MNSSQPTNQHQVKLGKQHLLYEDNDSNFLLAGVNNEQVCLISGSVNGVNQPDLGRYNDLQQYDKQF